MSDKNIRQEETIKDCPFCGSSVNVERVPLKHYQGCVIFEIKCSNCGCERTLTKNDSVYRTEEEARANAIAQWNERISSADDKPVARGSGYGNTMMCSVGCGNARVNYSNLRADYKNYLLNKDSEDDYDKPMWPSWDK